MAVAGLLPHLASLPQHAPFEMPVREAALRKLSFSRSDIRGGRILVDLEVRHGQRLLVANEWEPSYCKPSIARRSVERQLGFDDWQAVESAFARADIWSLASQSEFHGPEDMPVWVVEATTSSRMRRIVRWDGDSLLQLGELLLRLSLLDTEWNENSQSD
jgi:hypothetical protein